VSSWFIVLWLTKLFNFSQIFICHGVHGSSAAFLVVGSVPVTIVRKNPTDASVIPLLVWKFFCNLSTSLSFFSETCNNNCPIIFCETIFSLIFKCVIDIIWFLTRLTSSSGIQLIGWSLMSLFFQHKYGYIRDERSGVESYPYPWRNASDILTSTLAAFLFSSHPKRERDRKGHLNYYVSAYNRSRQLLHHKTKVNQIQQNTNFNLN